MKAPKLARVCFIFHNALRATTKTGKLEKNKYLGKKRAEEGRGGGGREEEEMVRRNSMHYLWFCDGLGWSGKRHGKKLVVVD